MGATHGGLSVTGWLSDGWLGCWRLHYCTTKTTQTTPNRPQPTTATNRLVNTSVDARDLSPIIKVDESAMTVTAPAGVTQRALLEYLAGYK
jgi:hypothetical protein